MKHLELDLSVSFERRELSGRVIHHLDAEETSGGFLRLHSRNLDIEGVLVAEGSEFTPTGYELGKTDPVEGEPLTVQLPPGCRRVAIDYRSRPDATGLQWLDPAQTAGGKLPYLYSQGQSIHNRTWIPCFDDPAIRITFDAAIRVAEPGMRAVMAAEDRSDPQESGVYRFHMPQPIPSYLIALAVGDLSFGEMGPRTGIWTEPSMLDAATSELDDTESMIEAVEKMFGPYRWGRYDILVLPPSFPLGGMENPRLTFATPTILAGDKSLVSLVAHELAHSWSGNLVTNHSWNDFWLNEGFTVYLERRIQEKLYGRARSEMEAAIGRSRLEDTFAELGEDSRDTWLFLDIDGRHPDEAMTDVPYEKGYLFLRLLEESFGRESFDRFLRGYFDEHAFQTMTTRRFLEYLDQKLLNQDPARAEQVEVEKWIYAPGLPPNAPRARSDLFDRVEGIAKGWLEGRERLPAEAAGEWSAHEWIHFLRQLPRDLSLDHMDELDRSFGLTASKNAEILCEWLRLAIRTDYVPARDRVRSFLVDVGRRKFVKPLFEELVGSEEGKRFAQEIYSTARASYHSMTSSTVDEILAG